MEFKNITTWSVSKGVATPKNTPVNFILDEVQQTVDGAKFERFAQQHTYSTDAPDGSYSADRFGEIVWQYYADDRWMIASCSKNNIGKEYKTRQFMPFKELIKGDKNQKFCERIQDRFVIYKEGTPLFKFESEVHIKDTENEEYTIAIKSGYSDLEPTKIIAQSILKILNNGHSPKSE